MNITNGSVALVRSVRSNVNIDERGDERGDNRNWQRLKTKKNSADCRKPRPALYAFLHPLQLYFLPGIADMVVWRAPQGGQGSGSRTRQNSDRLSRVIPKHDL
jgi:hypothetical protein